MHAATLIVIYWFSWRSPCGNHTLRSTKLTKKEQPRRTKGKIIAFEIMEFTRPKNNTYILYNFVADYRLLSRESFLLNMSTQKLPWSWQLQMHSAHIALYSTVQCTNLQWLPRDIFLMTMNEFLSLKNKEKSLVRSSVYSIAPCNFVPHNLEILKFYRH